jgi:hypothetical protein
VEDVTPGSGYAALRQTAAALQASLANGVKGLPPEWSSALGPARSAQNTAVSQLSDVRSDLAPATASMTPAGTPVAHRTNPGTIPAAGGLPAAARENGDDSTPIFQTLADGGWSKPAEQADRGAVPDGSLDFWRDPLSAPIPTQTSSDLDVMADVRPLRLLSAGRHRRDRPTGPESTGSA